MHEDEQVWKAEMEARSNESTYSHFAFRKLEGSIHMFVCNN